ncbi:TrmB family transcriptional regulator [Haloarchaeobius baliensis]|uniref:TrmB family transcriptional regulator n=1 Tax=Haloarchaeobius baliensis TaxID=1670458 RepID=UPI003F885129
MSTQRAALRRTAEPIPGELNSPTAKLVYLYLDTTGRSTVDEMQQSLNVPKLALFSVLGSLSESGLVECDGDCYAAS